MLQFPGGGGEHCDEQRLGLVEGEGEAEEVGAAGVVVFIVPRGFARGEVCEDVPGRVFGEEFFLRGVLASDFYYCALGAAAGFEEDRSGLRGIEGAGGIVVGEGEQEAVEFCAVRLEGVPPVAVAVVDDGAAAEDLLDAGGVFAGDADDHVDEFVELEGLFDDRADADEAGVFFGVAEGDLVGKWHWIGIAETGLKAGHYILERRPRTRSLRALPSTALPVSASFAAFTTLPICFMEVAPVAAMALAMAASISASLAPAGR
jgi:hypothetical protein